MAATSNSTPQPQPESRSAKKKKAKSEAAKQILAVSEAEAAAPAASVEPTANGADTTYESPYLKELYKSIRSIKKKINATQRVDSIIAENPDLSLDELLAQRKINIDQKVQAQKKPSLQASLSQQEEQIAQYKQFDEDYQKRIIVEKSALEAVHREELERVKEVTTADALEEGKKQANESLLILSKFLRAAAAKRQNGDEHSSENRAFEGALLLVYGGEIGAVEAMEKLISGSDEKVPATDGKLSELSFKEVKEASFAYTAPISAEEAWAEDVAQAEPETEPEPEPEPASTEDPSTPVGTDPTVAHAGLTEIDAEREPVPEEPSQPIDMPTVPAAATVDTSAANPTAESNWEAKLATPESNTEGWVEVARDPAETDTGLAATPAGPGNTQSWAEDVPVEQTPPAAEPATVPPAAPTGDGFHEVHHRDRGRNGSQGEYRGRGHRGYRGNRGSEGGYRGNRNGDGGYRGDRGEGGYQGSRGGDGGYPGGEAGYQGHRGGDGGYRGDRGEGGGYRPRGNYRSDRGDRGGGEGYRGRGRGGGGYRGGHRGRGGEPGS